MSGLTSWSVATPETIRKCLGIEEADRDAELRKEGLHPEQLKRIADDARYAGMSEEEKAFWKGRGL